MNDEQQFVPLSEYREYSIEDTQDRAKEFFDEMRRRRTVRQFSDRAVPHNVIEHCILTAGSAPSGANLQPWHFVVVTDPIIKHQIRVAAEAEEREFYTHRAPQEWLVALEPFGTDENKPYLDIAPCLIAIFVQRYGLIQDGQKVKHYYTQESVGIATGFLIAALHHAGFATLTHTPSPMEFLNRILGRPENEKPFLLLVVGYPAADAKVPDLQRKSLEDIATFL
jgi:nitroreductase